MRIAIIAFSQKGLALGERLGAHFEADGFKVSVTRCAEGGLGEWTREHFRSDRALFFIGSAGLAVRAIAPFVKSKTADPAVVVVDELGRHSVSLLSGHLGGANRLARRTAAFLGGAPVITTATDISGVFAVDEWARQNKIAIVNPERIKRVSSKLLAGETVKLKTEFPVKGRLPKNIIPADTDEDILISCAAAGSPQALWLVPAIVTLGIGCKRGAHVSDIEAAFERVLARAGCHPAALGQVCSIDLKSDEAGILEFCRRRSLPFKTFSAGQLARLPGQFCGSDFVKSVTGVDSVCERSAVLGAGEGAVLIAPKDAGGGVAAALAIRAHYLCFEEKENYK